MIALRRFSLPAGEGVSVREAHADGWGGSATSASTSPSAPPVIALLAHRDDTLPLRGGKERARTSVIALAGVSIAVEQGCAHASSQALTNDRRAKREALMTHAIGVRATSLVASATLLGAAVLAALTMSIVQRIAELPQPEGWVTIVPEPARPDPPRRAPEPPPPVRPIEGETILPIERPVPEAATQPAEFVPPRVETVPTIVNPQWVRHPRDLARYYPARALQREIEGRVVLDCRVSVRGVLTCIVVSETPANWGFGAAAMRIADDYRMVPAMRGGVAVEARHRMVVPFEIGV